MEVKPAGFADELDLKEREKEESRSGMALRIGLELLDEWRWGDLGKSSLAVEVCNSVLDKLSGIIEQATQYEFC